MTFRVRKLSTVSLGLAVIVGIGIFGRDESSVANEPELPRTGSRSAERSAPSMKELRVRARLLHEMLHATLQVVHHQYYREDEGLMIPAATMKKVFHEVEARHQIKLRWLAVSAQAMNRDHEPSNDFERRAVEVLTAGKTEHESVEDGVYRRASTIRLSSECLKCHLPGRTSTADRAAGLVIEFPVGTE